MYKEENEMQKVIKGDDCINTKIERYCTIEESLIESLKEVELMHKGEKPKRSLDDLWGKMEKWDEEES